MMCELLFVIITIGYWVIQIGNVDYENYTSLTDNHDVEIEEYCSV